MKRVGIILLLIISNLYAKDVSYFAFPLPEEYRGAISSSQRLRSGIIDLTESRYHNVLDISCPEFTKVFAAKYGVVTNVYPSYYNGGAEYKGHPTYGGLIEISHYDSTKTLYAHLSMTCVKEGEVVRVGQLIGRSGGVKGKRGSGKSTGPHLHFEIIIDIETFLE